METKRPFGNTGETPTVNFNFTDDPETVKQKLKVFSDGELLQFYRRNQERIHFLIAQRNNMAEQELLQEQIELAFALSGFLRTEIKNRKIPSPTTMEERDL
jgi:hypothetical protein